MNIYGFKKMIAENRANIRKEEQKDRPSKRRLKMFKNNISILKDKIENIKIQKIKNNKDIFSYERAGIGLIILLVLMFSLIPSARGEIQTLGKFPLNDCVRLKQVCDNCSFVNITSVLYPNSSEALSQVRMTKAGTDYNYTFCNTTALGKYIVNGFGDLDGKNKVFTYDFYVSYQGIELDTGQSIIYLIFMVLIIFIFCLSLYGAIKIPVKNKRNMDDEVISINYLKYAKGSLWYFCYLELLFISFLGLGITKNFLILNDLSSFFKVIYSIFLSGLIPVTFLTIFFIFIAVVNDKKIHSAIMKGFPVR